MTAVPPRDDSRPLAHDAPSTVVDGDLRTLAHDQTGTLAHDHTDGLADGDPPRTLVHREPSTLAHGTVGTLADDDPRTVTGGDSRTPAHDQTGTLAHDLARALAHDQAGTLAHDLAGGLADGDSPTLAHDDPRTLADGDSRTRAHEQARTLAHDHISTLAHDHISTLAHDLNNLLTAILGAAGTMLATPALDPALAEEALQIRFAAERAAALARLMVARQPAASGPSHVPLDSVIGRLAPLLRRALGDGIGLEVTAAAPAALVPLEPGGLDRVLLNLAANARHAMPAGGTLTVRTGRAGDNAWIAVTDTGTGIAATVLPHIFTPRFTTRGDAGGAGLGLASVVAILRAAGGTIAVESAPGQGTMFRLTLPCQSAASVSAASVSARSAPAASLPPASVPPASVPTEPAPDASVPTAVPAQVCGVVLLVEDEAPVCRVTTQGLRRFGWTVVHVDSAEAALTVVRNPPIPDVVVTDAGLPGMDGLALIAALRRLMPSLPAILVSGYAESGWADSGTRRDPAYEGMLVLAKPYEVRALSTAIASVVRK